MRKAVTAWNELPRPDLEAKPEEHSAYRAAVDKAGEALAEHASTRSGHIQLQHALERLKARGPGDDPERAGEQQSVLQRALIEGEHRNKRRAELATAVRLGRRGQPLTPQPVRGADLTSYYVNRSFTAVTGQGRIEGTLVDIYNKDDRTVAEYHSPSGAHCSHTLSPDDTLTIEPTAEQREAHTRTAAQSADAGADGAPRRTSHTYDPRRHPEQRDKCRRAAFQLLPSFKSGDPVTVTIDGKEQDMVVTRAARRSEGKYGSWESTRVTVSYGPGRYSTEITAESIATGAQSIRRRNDVS